MGEFNSEFRLGPTLTQQQLFEYVNRFRKLGIYGWALWRWSYMEDRNIPVFILTRIIGNRIQPGPLFKLDCLKDIKLGE